MYVIQVPPLEPYMYVHRFGSQFETTKRFPTLVHFRNVCDTTKVYKIEGAISPQLEPKNSSPFQDRNMIGSAAPFSDFFRLF